MAKKKPPVRPPFGNVFVTPESVTIGKSQRKAVEVKMKEYNQGAARFEWDSADVSPKSGSFDGEKAGKITVPKAPGTYTYKVEIVALPSKESRTVTIIREDQKKPDPSPAPAPPSGPGVLPSPPVVPGPPSPPSFPSPDAEPPLGHWSFR